LRVPQDVRQALATGDATDLQLAFQSLQEVMSSVTMPSGESASGLDANLLARYGQR